MIGDKVDWLVANNAEALAFAESATINEALTPLKAAADNFVITNGAADVVLFSDNQMTLVPVKTTTPVNTNGAGDGFAGALFARLILGDKQQQTVQAVQAVRAVRAVEFANNCASKIIAQNGARLKVLELAAMAEQT